MAVAPEALAASGLYERHERRVYSYCLYQLGAREEAEDAVQTTFLHALRGLNRGHVPRVESAWILKIARNVCIRRWETRGRERRFEVACDPHDLQEDLRAQPAAAVDATALADAVSRLPERQRDAILLREWQGLSYVEIAARLDLTVSAVEALLFRARRNLTEALSEEPAKKRRHVFEPGSLLASLKSLLGGGSAVKLAAAAAAIATGAIVGGTALVHRSHQRVSPGAAALAGRQAPLSKSRTPGSRRGGTNEKLQSRQAARTHQHAARPGADPAHRLEPASPGTSAPEPGQISQPSVPGLPGAPVTSLPVSIATVPAPNVPAVSLPTLPATPQLPTPKLPTPQLPITPSLPSAPSVPAPSLPATPSLPKLP
jgi:RNA polymerase sigma-70 factor (ECF subfamily)